MWLALGVVVLVETAWYEPRSMAKVRARVAQRGDPRKFDAYLTSRRRRMFRWLGFAAGAVFLFLGVLVLSGAA